MNLSKLAVPLLSVILSAVSRPCEAQSKALPLRLNQHAALAVFPAIQNPPAFPTAAALAKKVDAHYNHLQSLQTRYTERYRGMGLDRTETGTLLLKKPGRMRWSYDTPAGKLFVLDPKYAIAYTPGDAQADRMPAKQLDDLRSPLRFLLGHTELAKELDNLTLAPVANGFTLSGAPKGMQTRVKTLSLTVNAEGIIQAMRIEEVDGATTDFAFTDMHENVPTKDSDFTFTPPAGVQIVDGAAPI